MGDAKRRGTYEQRKATAFRMVSCEDGIKAIRIGDEVTANGMRMLVTGLTPNGFTSQVISLPPVEPSTQE